MEVLNKGRYDNTRILSAAGIDELHRPAVEANAMSLDDCIHVSTGAPKVTGSSRS